jgi:hypothetical protein
MACGPLGGGGGGGPFFNSDGANGIPLGVVACANAEPAEHSETAKATAAILQSEFFIKKLPE